MTRFTMPDRLDAQLRVMLAVLGAVLCIIGWYRYLSGS
jgi:hypothetical protein